MYDEKGLLTWEAKLDIYGKVHTFEGSSSSACPLRFQEQYVDVDIPFRDALIKDIEDSRPITGEIFYQSFRFMYC